MKKVFIVAGDPSGDLLASQLVLSLKNLNSELHVTGLGGNHLKNVSDKFLQNIVHQHVFGFYISPREILFFKRILSDVVKPELEKNKYDAVITVDFYGFNSRVAKIAKKFGHKVFYYASPQFWASRPGRADGLREIIDIFLCLFPFEADFYEKRGLPAKFVGHPLLDYIPHVSENDQTNLIGKVIGLLPGSRPDEIKRHLPIMLKAAGLIKKENPETRYVLFTVPHVNKNLYERILRENGEEKISIEMVEDKNFSYRTQLDAAMTASGMETLENALLGIPMVVMYKTSIFNYWVAKSLINISYIGMPNLLAGKEIVPEKIQAKATPENIAAPIIEWMKNPQKRMALRRELLNLRNQFGGKGASDRAARAILEKVA